jgi:hypothetical protein
MIFIFTAMLLSCDESTPLPSYFENYPTETIEKKWTFLIYLDGDNNLETDLITDFNET